MKSKNSHSGCLRFAFRWQVRGLLSLSMAILFSLSSTAFPCSAVARRGLNKGVHLAANYDWRAHGGLVFLSPRGQQKFSKIPSHHPSDAGEFWLSRYASLTLSQFGRDYPMQGINERGLAGMVLVAPAKYPTIGKRGVITENLWLQYQLDQFSSIQEVAEHLDDFGIRKISADLHWFLCDSSGECATVEFSEGQRRIYRTTDDRLQVLTNSPALESWAWYHEWSQSGRELPVGYGSMARFTRLAWRASHEGVLDLTSALNDVAQSGFTAWQTIFDLKRREMLVRLAGDDWRQVSFNGLTLHCRQDLPMLNLAKQDWQPYKASEVREILKSATEGLAYDENQRITSAVTSSERVVCK
ncbi:MAG: linear amide C-N hydrolase [bacterium]